MRKIAVCDDESVFVKQISGRIKKYMPDAAIQVYQHSYIDENGKYYCRMQGRNDGMLNLSDKLREERRKNSEKLIEKTKEKAAEKANTKQQAQVGANMDLKA